MKFHYEAITGSGEETSGVLEADSRDEVTRRLAAQGLVPFAVTDARELGRRQRRGRGKPPRREIMIALHELTTLIESEVPIAEAVGSLASSSHHPVIQDAFESMSTRLKRGEAFAAALADTDLKLPWYFGQLARSGEMTGQLGDALRRGVAQMEYDLEVAGELRGALVYPTILVATGIAAILVVFMVVVPNFGTMVDLDDPNVPWLAWAVISTGLWFNQHTMAVTVGVVGGLALLVSALAQPALRRRALEWLSRVPIIGDWLLEAETGRWTSMLSTLLGSRVELVQALDMAEQSVQLRNLRARLGQVTRATRGGSELSAALADHQAITATGCDLVRVGEKTGKLPQMLESLAKLYQQSGRERAKRALQLIEPIAILLIGAVIGVIITGVILAITASQDLGM